ncbi:conserved hypothetical protein [Perkinsus marinus ATCC 50983]|uniref:Uncharacterized protein n=1 Tax=Perkinsus marinus (strain ATCC 50983 / TXsc) TaxID=423536 RepID=C5KPH6_PERM5|nr:conserved hypothetical protein [Perkinsus marinus ATCC 50983]EER13605.1 conserved hypothetical protein [Perkinsus marinus ATCC 50983]|eukprot:XP_002781810.1 conserved hypothetical protein [Perkinsus marinus ATCC 50983]
MGNSSPVGVSIFGIDTRQLNQLRIGFGGVKGFHDPQPNTPTSQGFSALVLAHNSRIYAYKCPEEVLEAVRRAVDKSLIKKDKKCSKADGLHEFEFNKWIWAAHGQSTVDVRRYAVNIVESLREAGWGILDDIDMSRPFFVQVWVLHKIDQMSVRSPRRDILIGLHDKNDLRVVMSPQEEPNQQYTVQEAVRQGIVNSWQISSETDYSGAYQFQLAGSPFSAGENRTVPARQTLLGVLTELERKAGYRHYRSLMLSMNLGCKSSLLLRIPPPDAPKDRGTYVGMHLDGGGIIRIFPSPGEFLDPFLQQELGLVIGQSWSRGIKLEEGRDNAYGWELNGHPWETQYEDMVEVNILMGKILQKMWSLGFELMPKVAFTGRLAETSFMIFRKPSGAMRKAEEPVLCISFNNIDKVRICSPDDALVAELQPRIRMAFCPPEFPIEAVQDLGSYGRSAQFQLVKSPFHTWMPGPKTTMYATAVLLTVVNIMAELGWHLKTSLDLSSLCIFTDNSKYREELSSLYFTRK